MTRTLQRQCACGGGHDSPCSCHLQKAPASSTAQSRAAAPSVTRQVNAVLRQPGAPLDSHTLKSMSRGFAGLMPGVTSHSASSPQSELQVSHPNDGFERQADAVADQVMRSPASGRSARGHDFSRVRVHAGPLAAESARALGARAYTVGNDIVFAPGQYAPRSEQGRRLLAHELTHTLQQSGTAHRMVMRTWDKADTECAGIAKSDKWLSKVEVNQETPQNVVLNWSDGTTETDKCSSGKGHCCVDSSNPDGVACSQSQSQVNGSNCTPITQHEGFSIKHRFLSHKGVHFWSEFESDRSIALHQYDDYGTVDGTPLSHGCVRLVLETAKKIFCNVRQGKTMVQIHGFARPKCDTPSLQDVWKGDFNTAGTDLGTDGETNAQIREAREELNSAFGRTLSVAEIRKFTEKDIPRCKSKAPAPSPPTTTPP